MHFIQHCFIYRPSDSTVSKDAGIEPRTVATSALVVRRSNHSARSHPTLGPATKKYHGTVPLCWTPWGCRPVLSVCLYVWPGCSSRQALMSPQPATPSHRKMENAWWNSLEALLQMTYLEPCPPPPFLPQRSHLFKWKKWTCHMPPNLCDQSAGAKNLDIIVAFFWQVMYCTVSLFFTIIRKS